VSAPVTTTTPSTDGDRASEGDRVQASRVVEGRRENPSAAPPAGRNADEVHD